MSYNFFSEALQEQAYRLAGEIRDRKWDQLPGIDRPAASAEVIAELRRRCPGFSTEEYARAIADGFSNSR